MIKTNVSQVNQKLLISFLIKTKEGFELKSLLKKLLSKEELKYKIEENKTTLLFRFEHMYIKVYCDKYLPGKLELVLYERSKIEIYITMLILNNSKQFVIDDNTNGISFFTSIRKIIKKSNINDIEINKTDEIKVLGLNNKYKYCLTKTLRSNNNVLLNYTYKCFIRLPKNTISLIEIIIPVMFKQNDKFKDLVNITLFKNCKEVKF